MIFVEKQKSYPIERMQVMDAFKRVKANGGSAGIDGVTTDQVSYNLRKYLYPLWNRMASGSYFPQAVRQTLIPKGDGKMRALGIPTVVDRVAQQVIATELEAIVDSKFSTNSFGYRPNKSAHQAVEQCRINCMRYSWVIDLDIKGFFDNIDHELLMKAVSFHTDKKHILLYCKRWLVAPVQLTDGTIKPSEGKSTPQGGVISPVLANIFLDIVFDKWMDRNYPDMPFERYADDIVVHCHTNETALQLFESINKRFNDCKLALNQEKSKVVYCRSNQWKQPPFKPQYQKFDFLGFTFKPRIVKVKTKLRLGFTPAISQKSISRITESLFETSFHRWAHLPIDQIAMVLNPKLRGVINYYAPFRKSELRRVFRVLNRRLAKWVRNKYRKFRRRHKREAYRYLLGLAKCYPNLFVHWQHGFLP